MVGKGLSKYQEERAAAEARREQSKLNSLRLVNHNDSAKIRFITPAEEIFIGHFHRCSKLSKNNKQFWFTPVCPESEPPCNCPVTADPDTGRIPRFLQGAAWVYVREIIYGSKTEGEHVKVREIGKNKTLQYYTEVNEPYILMLKTSQLDTLTQFDNIYGSITDRDMMFTRNGAAGDQKTIHVFTPLDPSPANVELDDELPDLFEFLARDAERSFGLRIPQFDSVLGRNTSSETSSYGDDPDLNESEKIDIDSL